MPIGRIGTRRVSAEELATARAVEAAEAAARAVVPPKPHELKVTSRLRLSAAQLSQVAGFVESRGVSEGEALVLLGHATEDDVIAAEAELTAGRWMSSDQLAGYDGQAKDALPRELCAALQVLPVAQKDGTVLVAMRDPLDAGTLKTVEESAGGLKVVGLRAGPKALQLAIEKAFLAIDEDDPSTWLER